MTKRSALLALTLPTSFGLTISKIRSILESVTSLCSIGMKANKRFSQRIRKMTGSCVAMKPIAHVRVGHARLGYVGLGSIIPGTKTMWSLKQTNFLSTDLATLEQNQRS